MDLLDAHRRAMEEFDRRVRAVPVDRWDAATPCAEWTVHDLVNHLVVEQLWVPLLLDGATVAEVGDRFDGDQLGSDPVAAWSAAARVAEEAWQEPGAVEGMVHVSTGLIPAAEYGWQMVDDLTVHAWDLAVGIGVDSALDDGLVSAVHDDLRPHIDEWRGAGLFAPPLPAPAGANEQDRLLAWLGRQV
ncbi:MULTISPECIES: TIGR03086 family metal-binding protein [Actinoalloteichus]|uniref:TIGR03086 family protein n=1 Tax=Actinoalloteichus fjordicus TaxID=1612552 RepID=A0AAC9PRW3_9PSEU|nr:MULTISPECIES: TIGR03086 family metal-binding protein [Actinoalloteichus]APU14854.1 putative TIGR03086 family protein [Actinoalloteichus fjordicus]APU20823.1 putative TIGR03086 family protein [Actinoalloteichus sp. GBA129-24]